MRWLLFLCPIVFTGCTLPPVVDLRASGEDAQFYQRDLNECKTLIEGSRSIWFKPLTGHDPMLVKCLEGRGHSILTLQ